MSHKTISRRGLIRPMLLSAMTLAACTSQGIDSSRVAGPARKTMAVVLPDGGVILDALDAIAADYSGSVTIGDPREGAPIPPQYSLSVDLGLSIRRESDWTGELSFKRFVTTNPASISSPNCERVDSRELKAPLDSLFIASDGTFQATSAPVRFCIRSNKAVERRVQLSGTVVTRNNCAHVEIRGAAYGSYQETLRGMVSQLPDGGLSNETPLVGTFVLAKVKDLTDGGLPTTGFQCPDLNPDPLPNGKSL